MKKYILLGLIALCSCSQQAPKTQLSNSSDPQDCHANCKTANEGCMQNCNDPNKPACSALCQQAHMKCETECATEDPNENN